MLNREQIKNISPGVLFDEPMSRHTTFKIGGKADAFVSASSEAEISALLEYCKKNNVPYMVIGNGSNMLVSDKGIRGLVIHIGKDMCAYEIDGDVVYAEAGILLSTLASVVMKAELEGFEAFSGIPGTLGGAVYMNAGAYEHELREVLEAVTYINPSGDIITASADRLSFGYRKSIFQTGDFAVLSCKLRLKKGNQDEIIERMKDYNKRRSDKQPLSMPSAGSTFKRPEGHFAGKLIQDCELMGYTIGGAQVSTKHAGFIVNTGNATAKDVLDLIEHIQKTVYDKFGVMLEPEVRLTGEK